MNLDLGEMPWQASFPFYDVHGTLIAGLGGHLSFFFLGSGVHLPKFGEVEEIEMEQFFF